MSIQKILIATVIATVFVFALDYLWYGMLMADYFGTSPGERAAPLFPYLILGILIFSYAFCKMYSLGVDEDKTAMSQGINYGILVALLVFIPMAFIRYAVNESSPLTHYLVDAVFRVVQMVVLGIIVANYLKPVTASRDGAGTMGGG